MMSTRGGFETDISRKAFMTDQMNGHDNNMPLKRASLDSSIFPPKKRALLEHKAEVLSDVSNLHHQKSINKFEEKCFSNGHCQEYPFLNSRHRTDSSVGENSDRFVLNGKDDALPCFENLDDHRTPERNPRRHLNSQIAKPLFQATDSDALARKWSQIGYLERNQTEKENQAEVNVNTKFHTQKKLQNKSREIPSSKRSPLSGKDTRVYTQNRSHYHSNRYLLTNENSSPGPMVSLIERFNAEAENVKLRTQSNTINTQNQTNRLVLKSLEDNISKGNEQLENKSRKSHVLDYQPYDNSTNLKATLIEEKGEYFYYDDKKDFFTCTICNKQIKQKGHFLVHLKGHENQNCKCRICGVELQSLEKLKEHMQCYHKGDKPFKCDHCPREFSQYNNLRRHLRVHREKIYKCALCDREFNEEFYLTMHMGTHTGKRVYSCGVCNMTFTSSQDLKMHVKTHSPSQLHTCDVCGKSFSKACVLRQHKKGHSGDRPHKCEKCSKTFIHRHHLTMHMRSHAEDKPYTCEICKKEFYQSSHLYKHLHCHSDKNEEMAVNAMKEKLFKYDMKQKKTDTEYSRIASQVLSNKTFYEEERKNRVQIISTKELSQESQPFLAQSKVTAESQQLKSDSLTECQQLKSGSLPDFNSWQTAATKLPEFSSWQTARSARLPDFNSFQSPRTPRLPDIKTFRSSETTGVSEYSRTSQKLPNQVYSPATLAQTGVRPALPLSHNYDPVYLAYASQYRAYCNSLYMMNYMSHNALLHPGNSSNSNGGGHMTLKENNVENDHDILSKYSTQKTDTLRNETGSRNQTEHVKLGENDARTEIAEELVKLSNGKIHGTQNSSLKISQGQSKDINQAFMPQSYTINTKESPITHCTRNTCSNSELIQPRQKSFSQIAQNMSKLNNKMESRNKDNSFPMDCTTKKEWYVEVSHDGEALNLSCDKDNENRDRIDVTMTEGLSPKHSFLGKQNIVSTKFWNPAHSLPDYDHPKSTSSIFTTRNINSSPAAFYLPFSSHHRNHFHQNDPRNFDRGSNFASAQSPVVKNKTDSPKKRHASSHVPETISVGLDLSNSTQIGRQRRWSEMQVNSIVESVTENPHDSNVLVGCNKVVSALRHLQPYCTKPTPNIDTNVYGVKMSEMKQIERDSESKTQNKVKLETRCRYEQTRLYGEDTLKNEQSVLENCEVRMVLQREVIGDGIELEEKESFETIEKNECKNDGDEQFIHSVHSREMNDQMVLEVNNSSETIVKNKRKDAVVDESVDSVDVSADPNKTLTRNHNYFDDSFEDRKLQIHLDNGEDDTKNVENYENNPKNEESLENDPKHVENYEHEPKNVEHYENDPKNVKGFENDQKNLESFENDRNIVESYENEPMFVESFHRNTKCVESNKNDPKIDENNKSDPKKVECHKNVPKNEEINENPPKNKKIHVYENYSMNDEMFESDAKNVEMNGYDPNCVERYGNDPKCVERYGNDPKCVESYENDLKCIKSYENDLKCVENYENDQDGKVINENDLKNVRIIEQYQTSDEILESDPKHENDPKNIKIYQNDPKNMENYENEPKCTEFSENVHEINVTTAFECQFCGRCFNDQSILYEHMIMHTDDKPYSCNVCRKTFSQKHNLNRHKMSHKSKSFECTVCGRTFKESFYLQMHMKVHTEENSHYCEICGKQVEKSEILNHTRQHLGDAYVLSKHPTYEQIGPRVQEILRDQSQSS